MDTLSRLDNFFVIRTLGTGATAKVKLVQDPESKEFYAAKILKNPNEQMQNAYSKIIKNEIKCLQGLNHPNIVNILSANLNGLYYKKGIDVGVSCVYIVLELCKNGELIDLICKTGPLSEEICRFYFFQIVDALEACHGAGIAHRDLKPDNILIDSEYNFKIADFGFSALMNERDERSLRTFLGTEYYMSPERLMHLPYDGESSDLFSAGIILFILLSGTPPFTRANEYDNYYMSLTTNSSQFWKMHSRRKRSSIQFSDDFKNLISKMLASNPKKRLTLEKIREHPWSQGTLADLKLIVQSVASRFQRIEEAAQRAKDNKVTDPGLSFQGNKYFRGSQSFGLSSSFEIPVEGCFIREVVDGELDIVQFGMIKTGILPKEIMGILSNEVYRMNWSCDVVHGSFKLLIRVVMENDTLVFKTNILRTKDEFFVLVFTLVEGDIFDLAKIVNDITEKIVDYQESI